MLPRLQRDPGSHQRTESVPVAPGPPGFQRSGARIMIAARRLQRNFGDGFIAEAVEDLWEPWMRHADQALEDDALLIIIQQELAKRCKRVRLGAARRRRPRSCSVYAAVEACARLELRSA